MTQSALEANSDLRQRQPAVELGVSLWERELRTQGAHEEELREGRRPPRVRQESDLPVQFDTFVSRVKYGPRGRVSGQKARGIDVLRQKTEALKVEVGSGDSGSDDRL